MKKLIVLNHPKFAASFFSYTPLADIPNQAGFKCIVLCKSGAEYLATVIRDNQTGLHSLDINQAFPYAENLSWRKLTPEDEEAIKNAE